MPTFNGTSDDDIIFGSSTSDVINAYDGDDDVYGGSGDDFIDGGNGADRIYGEGGNDEIDGGAENDLLDGGDGDDTLTGGAGRDALYGGSGSDTLIGGDGNDTLDGGSGTDIAQGGAGNDVYFVDSSSDVVQENAAEGDDHVRSTAQTYTLTANIERLTFVGTGNFTGTGNASDNVITGGTGNDTLIGGAGADTINGDSGTDTASYSTSSAGVTVNLATGINTGGDAQGDTLTGIENITGSSFADTLTGDGDVNTLTGGAGADTLNGGAGADTLIGGTGSDTASYVTSSSGVTVNLATGVHTGGDAAGDTLVAIENIIGSDFADSLTGDSNSNLLAGGAGDDTFYFSVGGAADRIDGGTESAADTVDIAGTGAADAFFIETVADYNARTGAGYAGPAELLVSVGSTIQTELNEIETIAVHGGAGADTLTIPGGFTGTALGSNAFVFDGGAGDDTVDVSDRTSAHKIVADGGDEDTATGDIAILGFDFADATAFERIEDGSGNLIGVKITHDIGGSPVTDEFTDFESFQFTDGTRALEELVAPSSFNFTTAVASGTTRVSVSSAGSQANHSSDKPEFSGDGRYVVFSSWASNLVAGDTNETQDVFVRDLATGITTCVSVDSGETQANGGSHNASISMDGRYVVFESTASNLVAGDTNGTTDVFVRDLVAGTTTMVGADARSPQISADGRYVVFHNGSGSFVRDMVANTTTPVVGGQFADISADGRYVVFQSALDNLVPGDTNGARDVFVRDMVAGTTTRVSVDSAESQAIGANSSNARISADGRYVVFASEATNLVAGDTNGSSDIFVRDLVNGTTVRVSVDSAGLQGNGASYAASISSDGRYVVFYSTASNLVTGDTNARDDIFVHDLLTGTTTRSSVDSSGGQANNTSLYPIVSADGSLVAFTSNATNFVINDTNSSADIFVSQRSIQWNDVVIDLASPNPAADSYKIEWGDGETTFHSLWGGTEQLVRHDYAANVSGTATIHVMSGGSDIDTMTFAVQTAPSGTSGTSLTGTAGSDILIGHNGADTLNGLGGNDMLSGGLGADVINGGAGSDNLRGGAGNDTLTGDSDNDTFVFQSGFGHDTITDFAAGAGVGDVIELHDDIFADFAAVQAASSQVGSDVLITVDASNSILLTNVTLANLHQNDFLFV